MCIIVAVFKRTHYSMMPASSQTQPATLSRRHLTIIFVVAVILRFLAALLRHDEPLVYAYTGSSGGDVFWYMVNGLALFSGQTTGTLYGMPYDISQIPTAPLYLIFTGFIQTIFGTGNVTGVHVIWLLQSIMGGCVALFAAGIARQLHSTTAGYVAAWFMTLSPTLILEAGDIATESLYIFFVVASLWWIVSHVLDGENPLSGGLIAGVLMGLAALTRAVFVLFPVGVALLLMVHRRRVMRIVPALLLAFAVTIGTWTAYNVIAHDRLVIVSSELMPAFWRGAVDTDGSPQENDEQLGDSTPAEQAAAVVSADPAGFVLRRVRELTGSYLQPHGTIKLGGEGLRELTANVINSGFDVASIQRLITADHFAAKAIMYVLHLGGMAAGVIGMWQTRKKPATQLLAGFVSYTTLVHLVLLALPRYVFPAVVILWICAALPVATLIQRRTSVQ